MYVIFSIINEALRIAVSSFDHSNDLKVRLGRVLWKRKLYELDVSSVRDFLCIFSSTVNLDYVLKPYVSLYAVTKHEAVFVETTESVNIYSSDVNAFMYSAQFDHCRKVIKMPIKYFYVLAAKIGRPSMPVIWISQTGRCGSTLLCQLLEKVPGTLIMSEPDALMHIDLMRHMKVVLETEIDNLFQDTVKVLCKPRPRTERICIKTRGACISWMNHLSKSFPDFKQIFLYWNCKATISSYLAVLSSDTFTMLGRICYDSKWFSLSKPYLRRQMDFHSIRKLNETEGPHCDANESKIFLNCATTFTYMWANYILIAQDAMSRNTDILPVKYGDLVTEKIGTCRIMLKQLGLDTGQLNTVLTTFDQDSQRMSLISRARIGASKRRVISDQEQLNCDTILSMYRFPLMKNDFRL